MSERIYLDWNATAPLRKKARAAALAALEVTGNPSSVHGEGRAARHWIEQAREEVAALVGAAPRNVVFTSGGTEANMLALVPMAPRDRLLVSAIEHPSILARRPKGGGRAGRAHRAPPARAGNQGRQPGARPARRHRERRGNRRLRGRGSGGPRGPCDGTRAHGRAARPARGRPQGRFPWSRHFRRRFRAAAPIHVVRGGRNEG